MIKQVIVVRTKYTDWKTGDLRGVRCGKLCAQVAHASMMFLVERLKLHVGMDGFTEHMDEFEFPEEQFEWLMNDKFTKITLQVNTEEELLSLREQAQEAGLESYLVQDAGDTEFSGVSTFTALAIGPDFSEKIDPITRHLKLY